MTLIISRSTTERSWKGGGEGLSEGDGCVAGRAEINSRVPFHAMKCLLIGAVFVCGVLS
jgi:hypothetical protein